MLKTCKFINLMRHASQLFYDYLYIVTSARGIYEHKIINEGIDTACIPHYKI